MGLIQISFNKLRRLLNKKVKADTQKWFDGEVLENINARDKLCKRFMRSRLHIDKYLYKIAKSYLLKLIATKK